MTTRQKNDEIESNEVMAFDAGASRPARHVRSAWRHMTIWPINYQVPTYRSYVSGETLDLHIKTCYYRIQVFA